MKTLKHLIYLLLITITVVGCSRDFDEPPLSPEVYDGPPANMTIGRLKSLHQSITDPTLIDVDYIIKAYVSGNDISGNIYKQLYIQDETGAINIGIDQNSMYTEYRVGQEVYINLHGLYMIKYGGELQIGYGGTQANRIPWLIFNDHTSRNDFPNPANVTPLEVELGKLTDDMVNKVVVIKNIYFVNADGQRPFTSDNQTTNEPISDVNGNKLDVRTSSYSAELAKKVLPEKYGTVTGVLGRYNGGWQLFLRDAKDIGTFGLDKPGEGGDPEPPVEGVILNETFGTKDVSTAEKRELIADYDGYVSISPIVFTGSGDIRSTKAFDNHVWLKTGVGNLKIAGINTTGKTNIKLSYDITANVYTETEQINVNVLKVKCDGTELTVPSFVLNTAGGYNNKYYTVEITNLPSNFSTLEFVADETNTLGFRLDNIKIYTDDVIVPTP
jgi:hypothetical protein